MCGEYRIYPAMLEVEPSDCFDKEIARKTLGSRVMGWNGDTFLTSKHCTVQRKDECRNILFVWLSFLQHKKLWTSWNDDVTFPDFVQLVQQLGVHYIEGRKFILNSCYLKIGTFRRGNYLCFRVDCYQTSLGSPWFWVMSQSHQGKGNRQKLDA